MALELAPAGLQAGPATMTTIIMLTEIAIGLEGLEQTSRSRTPLSIAELNLKFSLPLPLNASGMIDKLFLCLALVLPTANSSSSAPSAPSSPPPLRAKPGKARHSQLLAYPSCPCLTLRLSVSAVKNPGAHRQHDHAGGAARGRASLDSRNTWPSEASTS